MLIKQIVTIKDKVADRYPGITFNEEIHQALSKLHRTMLEGLTEYRQQHDGLSHEAATDKFFRGPGKAYLSQLENTLIAFAEEKQLGTQSTLFKPEPLKHLAALSTIAHGLRDTYMTMNRPQAPVQSTPIGK